MALYNPNGPTEIKCADCSNASGDVTGELVGETDDKEIHTLECRNCGNEGSYIRETTLGGGEQIDGNFEQF